MRADGNWCVKYPHPVRWPVYPKDESQAASQHRLSPKVSTTSPHDSVSAQSSTSASSAREGRGRRRLSNYDIRYIRGPMVQAENQSKILTVRLSHRTARSSLTRWAKTPPIASLHRRKAEESAVAGRQPDSSPSWPRLSVYIPRSSRMRVKDSPRLGLPFSKDPERWTKYHRPIHLIAGGYVAITSLKPCSLSSSSKTEAFLCLDKMSAAAQGGSAEINMASTFRGQGGGLNWHRSFRPM